MLFTLPNILTLLNLLSGCCGLIFVMQDRARDAILCIALSLIFDFLDGLVARLQGKLQPLGKELDSLADVVSFGALPGAMLFQIFQGLDVTPGWLSFSGFLVTLFGALRLARFNLTEAKAPHFEGLPIPSSAIYITGLYWLNQFSSCMDCSGIFINTWFLTGSIIVLSYLMVSSHPHFSFKFKQLSWRGNEVQWMYLLLVIPMIFLLRELAITMAIVLYVLLSLIYFTFQRSD